MIILVHAPYVFIYLVVLSLSECVDILWFFWDWGCKCCWLLVLEEECSWRQLCLTCWDEEDTLPVCLDQWGNRRTPPEFDNAFPPAPNFLRCSATTSSNFWILYLLVSLKRRCERIHIITEAAIKRHPNTAAIIIKSRHSSIITTLEDFLTEEPFLSPYFLFFNGCDFISELNSLSSLSK